jgi:diaminopimelate epimerase
VEHHPWFPERTSVLWATCAGENLFDVRIWERGVGETLACGTGACAVAVAAVSTARAKTGLPVTVAGRGGRLQVNWQPGEQIFLTGPAQHLFQGKWPLDL